MNSSVMLQDPFSYKVLGIIISGSVLAALIIAYLLLRFLKKRPKKAKAKPEEKPKAPALPWQIKNRYLDEISQIENDLSSEKIDVRESYQRMSMTMRSFVKELTGVDATTATLADIRALNIPKLEDLIKEYYAPEFADEVVHEREDAMNSMARTKKVIAEWN